MAENVAAREWLWACIAFLTDNAKSVECWAVFNKEVLMFGSNVLEVAIGIVFVYLLLSLLCSTLNEFVITRFLALRATTLEDGIRNLLNDLDGKGLTTDFYNDPMIKGLPMSGRFDKLLNRQINPADIPSSD